MEIGPQIDKDLTAAGYRGIELIARTRSAAVYRALAPPDGRTVVLKVAGEEDDHLDHEAAVLRRLPGRTFRRISLGAAQGLEMPDTGGVALRRVLEERRIDFGDALAIGAAVAGDLSDIHRSRVIHKDVNPSNIIWNQETGAVRLIDFGIASELPLEQTGLAQPSQLEGTLAYMPPEQTGRMNRLLDSRADLYSLGVTLYEMFTSRRPFVADDPLDLVYCHLARAPAPPREWNPDIPELVSDIVLKLMAKEPEDRYQTAWGLQADLLSCAEAWRCARKVEPFPLGRRDVPDRLSIPHRLYGRDEEIAILRRCLSRASTEGSAELILLGGPPGIGKSALARELLRPVTGKRGLFATGKCDRFRRATPYDALGQALGELVRHLLGAEPSAVASWREALLSALGENGAVVAAIVPELSLLIGPQPPLREVGPVEARNRSTRLLRLFVRALGQDDHPLVLFLDDLQWADPATLDLLCDLAADPDLRFCCVILAYRDNEVGEGHPLRAAVARMREQPARLTSLTLSPLPEGAVVELVAAALRAPASRAASLARIVERKTGGNPFVIRQFLQGLHRDGVIAFAPATAAFTWDEAVAEAAPMAENAAELLRARLGELSPAAQEALRIGACLGDSFDIGTLAAIQKAAVEDTLSVLREPVDAGMLIPQSHRAPSGHPEGVRFAFAHDRIREAAYALIEERDRPAVHLDIGRRLRAMTPADSLDEWIFVILDQFKAAHAPLATEQERIDVAALYLRGGERAFRSAAYEVAASLLDAGVRVLGEQGFERAPALAVPLYRAAALAACLARDFDGVERLLSVLSSHAASVLDEVQVDIFRIRSAQAQDRHADAVCLGFHALMRLGITFPEKPAAEDVRRAIATIRERLSGKQVEELAALPSMRDPRALAAMEVISQIVAMAFQVAPEHCPLLVTEGVRLSIEYGSAPCTPLLYAYFAHFLNVVGGDLQGGERFGRLAMAVLSQMGSRELLAKVIVLIEGFVHVRTAHFRDTLDPLRLGYQEGVASGDFEGASYCGFSYCHYAYLGGAPLRGLSEEIREMRRACRGLHQEASARKAAVLEQVTMNLLGLGGQTTALQGEAFDERAVRPVLLAAGDSYSVHFIAQHRILLLGFFGDFRGVLEEFERSQAHFPIARQLADSTRVQASVALSCLMVATEESEERRDTLSQRAEAILAELREAARHAPMNFVHHVALLEAVRSGLAGGDRWITAGFYDEAITAAEAQGFVQDAALACELAGRFWLSTGKNYLARAYLDRARRLYARWGAVAKVAQIEQRHADLLPTHAMPMSALMTTSQAPAVLLDATSLFKATRAITSSLTLHELPMRLLSTIMENACAQRGAFFVVREDALVLDAVGDPSTGAVPTDAVPIERAGDRACLSVVRAVATTRSPLLLEDARQSPQTSDDPYVISRQTRSVLCAPILSGSALRGVLYLENDLVTGAFTPERVEVVGILSAQAGIALENALLYDKLARLLDERTRLLAQAEEGVRARDVFLTIAAHELRTPLTPLRMVVEGLLGEGAAHKAATLHKLSRAARQIGRLERLVNDLLLVSSLAAGPPKMHLEDVDLSEVVCEVAEKHATPLKHAGSTLLLKAEPGTLGRWDRARLSQIVEQLLSNAIKFGAGKPIQVQVEATFGRARLVVRDRGPGIPPGTRERIFEAFARAVSERHFGGLGLGLWITRRLVDALGGSIRVESERGAGATFTVELPQGAQRPQASNG